MGEQATEYLAGVRLEKKFQATCLKFLPLVFAGHRGFHALDFTDGQQLAQIRFLVDGGDEVGEQHVHGIHLALGEEVHCKLGNGAGVGKFRHIRIAQLGGQFAAGAADELRTLATGTDEYGVLLVQLGCVAEQGGVERSAKSLVRADEHDSAFTGVAAFLGERMLEVGDRCGDFRQHAVHQVRVGPTGHGCVLRTAHLGRRHHLHGLGDLGRVLDRLDASANVARAGHASVPVKRFS